MSARAVFLEAIELTDEADRQRFVENQCRGDQRLRAKVLALLSAHQDPASLLENPLVAAGNFATELHEPTQEENPLSEQSGSTIGPYKLLQEIGQGGFGVVYMAEQQEPVRRTVALKILKPGMDTREVIARFEAERQALALMDHPNIARVLDAGATDSGRPYFVMELVRGVPLTEFCDKNGFTPNQRLELFVMICQAVQHAHQKGVIHRDLKPSNVMVTLHDGKPVPKVIDFGIAKAISQKLTEKTLFTRYGQMIGTPQYMSPEQAEMSGLDVDTRSDIYSLGVILYELLTGTTPLQKEQICEAGYAEMLRLIQEQEAPKPSTRVSTLTDRLTVICEQRKTSERSLGSLLRGDLDWIVLRAIEKDRSRRYETANGLAEDVQRHLRGDTVTACPPTLVYKARKFVARYRRQVAVASTFFALLTVSSVISWSLYLSSLDANREADAATENERAQRKIAVELQGKYERERNLAVRSEQAAIKSKERAKNAQRDLEVELYEDRIQRAEAMSNQGNLVAAGRLLGEIGTASDSDHMLDLHGWEWRRLTSLGPHIEERHRFENSQATVEFHAPTRRLATVDFQGRLTLRDASTFEKIWESQTDIRPPCVIKFSPDGRLLSLTPDNVQRPTGGDVEIWSSGGKALLRRSFPTKKLSVPAFSPDGKLLAINYVVGQDWRETVSHLAILSTQNFEVIWQQEVRGRSMSLLSFSDDSKRVIANSLDHFDFDSHALLEAVDFANDEVEWSLTHRTSSTPTLIPNSENFAIVGPHHELRVFDQTSGTEQWRAQANLPDIGTALRIHPGGTLALSQGDGGNVAIWDLQKRRFLQSFTLAGNPPLPYFSGPDAKFMALSDNGRSLNELNITNPYMDFRISGHTGRTTGIAMAKGGAELATVASDGTLRVWNATTGMDQRVLTLDRSLHDIAFSPDSSLLAVGGAKSGVQLLDAETLDVLFAVPSNGEYWEQLTFSPDGRLLVGADKNVTRLWQVSDSNELLSRGEYPSAYGAVFVDDKTLLLLRGNGEMIQADLRNDKIEVVRTSSALERATPIFLLPAQNRAVIGVDFHVEVWDLNTRQMIKALPDAGQYIVCLACTADGSRVFAGDANGDIYLWNLATGSRLLKLEGHERGESGQFVYGRGVQRLVLNDDESTLYSCGADTTIRVWESRRPSTGVVRTRGHVQLASSLVMRLGRQGLSYDQVVKEIEKFAGTRAELLSVANQIAKTQGVHIKLAALQKAWSRQRPIVDFPEPWIETVRSAESHTNLTADLIADQLEGVLGCSLGDTAGLLEVDEFTWFESAAEFSRVSMSSEQVDILFRRLIEKFPGSPYLHYLEASTLAARSDWQAAKSSLESTLELLPDQHSLAARTQCELAAIALFLKAESQYQTICRQLMSGNPKQFSPSINWRIARVCLEGPDEDEMRYRQAVDLLEELDKDQLSAQELPYFVSARLLGLHRLGEFSKMEEPLNWMWDERNTFDNYLAVTREHLKRVWAFQIDEPSSAHRAAEHIRWLEALQPSFGKRVMVPHLSWQNWLHMQLSARLANETDSPPSSN